MPYIIKPERWRELPNYPVEIDWSSEFNKGLLFWAIPFGNRAYDLVSRVDASALTSGASIGANAKGRALRFDGSQASGSCSFGDVTTFDGLRAITVDMLLHHTSTDCKPFAKWGNGNSILLSAGGSVIWVLESSSGSRSRRDSNSAPPVGRPYVLNCSFEDNGTVANNGAIYFDGISQSTTNADNSCGSINNSAVILQLGIAYDGSPMNGAINYARVVNRARPPGEVAALAEYPWHGLKKRKRRIYFPVSSSDVAAALSGTGSLSALLNTSIQLGAVSLGLASNTANAQTAIPLDAVMLGTGNVSAALNTQITPGSTESGSGSASMALDSTISMASIASGSGSASAAANTVIQVSMQALGQALMQTNLNTALNLALQASGQGSMTANLNAGSGLSVQMDGHATGQADLNTQLALLATLLGSGQMTASLTVGINFSSTAQGQGSAQANLTTVIALTANMLGRASMSGTLALPLDLSAILVGHGSMSANLNTVWTVVDPTARYTLCAAARDFSVASTARNYSVGFHERLQ